MRVLVTGGAGFIGSHVVRALVRRGDTVVVLDDFSSGFRRRVADLADGVKLVAGDIRDVTTTTAAASGCDVVLHLAALPSIQRSFDDPARSVAVNVGGTVNVMTAAAAAGVARVVLASSSSVYGAGSALPRREEQRPEPQSPYAASKLAAEGVVHSLGARHGIATVALRYFNVFGPDQDPGSEYAAAVPRFIAALLADIPPTVYGDGSATRDFTYVDNVVAATLLATEDDVPSGTTCNVASGGEVSVRALLDALRREVGASTRAVHEPARAGDATRSVADISLARRLLGYDVVVPFRDGLSRTVAWYRDELGPPSSLEVVA